MTSGLTTKQKREWLIKQVGSVIGENIEEIDFYYKAMHDYGMNIYDADDYAWLNTLFRYDIGAERALEITNWYFENEDATVCESVDVSQKGTLQNICELELGFHFDFSHWPDDNPDHFEYGFKEWYEEK